MDNKHNGVVGCNRNRNNSSSLCLQVQAPSDDDLPPSDALADLSAAAAAADGSEPPAEVQEHLYYLPAPGLDPTERDSPRKEVPVEPRFLLYNQIARYT